MAAPIGHERYGGRAKGTPNKRTIAALERLRDAGFDPHEAFLYWAEVLRATRWPRKSKKRCEVYLGDGEWGRPGPELAMEAARNLAEFVAPKLSRVTMAGDVDNPLTVIFGVDNRSLDGAAAPPPRPPSPVPPPRPGSAAAVKLAKPPPPRGRAPRPE
jgi:hypothetical protein